MEQSFILSPGNRQSTRSVQPRRSREPVSSSRRNIAPGHRQTIKWKFPSRFFSYKTLLLEMMAILTAGTVFQRAAHALQPPSCHYDITDSIKRKNLAYIFILRARSWKGCRLSGRYPGHGDESFPLSASTSLFLYLLSSRKNHSTMPEPYDPDNTLPVHSKVPHIFHPAPKEAPRVCPAG